VDSAFPPDYVSVLFWLPWLRDRLRLFRPAVTDMRSACTLLVSAGAERRRSILFSPRWRLSAKWAALAPRDQPAASPKISKDAAEQF